MDTPDEGSAKESQFDAVAVSARNHMAPNVTVRTLLGWVGAERRGSHVVARVRRELASRGLQTEPDFADSWIDSFVAIRPVEIATIATSTSGADPTGAGVCDDLQFAGAADESGGGAAAGGGDAVGGAGGQAAGSAGAAGGGAGDRGERKRSTRGGAVRYFGVGADARGGL